MGFWVLDHEVGLNHSIKRQDWEVLSLDCDMFSDCYMTVSLDNAKRTI